MEPRPARTSLRRTWRQIHVPIAQWCFKHRWIVVGGWLIALVVVLGLAKTTGSDFNSDFTLSSTDSGATVSLLHEDFPAASGENDQIVFRATGGATTRASAVRARVTAALERVTHGPRRPIRPGRRSRS
ncbi:hypothetical protein ACIGXM_34115 [Kitasatospora sp. NPDC052896]|uniref:hypothetical protein n=1 Tax=Kitasatospora sp. NPDC052896 TaxID=3364061 RepID=UPI0037CA3060